MIEVLKRLGTWPASLLGCMAPTPHVLVPHAAPALALLLPDSQASAAGGMCGQCMISVHAWVAQGTGSRQWAVQYRQYMPVGPAACPVQLQPLPPFSQAGRPLHPVLLGLLLVVCAVCMPGWGRVLAPGSAVQAVHACWPRCVPRAASAPASLLPGRQASAPCAAGPAAGGVSSVHEGVGAGTDSNLEVARQYSAGATRCAVRPQPLPLFQAGQAPQLGCCIRLLLHPAPPAPLHLLIPDS